MSGTVSNDELLAAELAMGLLDAGERRAAEARLLRDPTFGTLCDRWAAYAASLLEGAETAPGPDLWERIAARLPANDRPAVDDLRRAVRRWRGAAVAMTVVAAGLGSWGASVHRPPPPAPRAQAVVQREPILVLLTSATGPGIASLSIDRAGGRITVAQHALDIGRRSAELWVIPADNVPRSLGVLPPPTARPVLEPGPSAPRIAKGMKLAITLEPPGGSPTGKPTGPIILQGEV